MNIALASDNNFIQHCAVTLVSILKNNPEGANIYLLTEGLDRDNESKLKELTISNNGNLFIINVNSEVLNDCPMPIANSLSHISIATYYRLLIAKLLPDTIDKVIYLDCDIVVRHSLIELWNYPISNWAMGAVYQIVEWNVAAIKRLGYPVSFGYFNAGVLLINLKYWRDNHITDRLFEYINLKSDVIYYHDQDALNGLLHDQCLRLPCKWNMLTGFFMKHILSVNEIDNGKIINNHSDYKQQLIKEKDDPTVIHFVSKPKPWDAGCDHPYKNEYYHYLSFIPWDENKSHIIPASVNNRTFFLNWIKNKIKNVIWGNPYFKINQ
jgi:lipopolysaccharide biosynthesis glycosyltransferase